MLLVGYKVFFPYKNLCASIKAISFENALEKLPCIHVFYSVLKVGGKITSHFQMEQA